MPRVKEEITVTNTIDLSDRPIYITNPKLANALGKSLATILNWIREGRIVPDGFIDGDKPNDAIYTLLHAKQLQEEVRTSPSGRPTVKGIIPIWQQQHQKSTSDVVKEQSA